VAKLSWFAVCCANRSEFRIEEAFREGELVRRGCEVYCPTEQRWHRERRCRRIVRWPLLPGYVFAGLPPDMHGDLPFQLVKAVEGVINLVSGPRGPIPLVHRRPSEEFLRQRRERWRERRKRDDDRTHIPEEPPVWPISIEEIREMEARGDSDFTQDRLVAERAAKLVRRRFNSFHDLAKALSEEAA